MKKNVKAISKVASLLLALMLMVGAVFSTTTPVEAATGTLNLYKLSGKKVTDADMEAGKTYHNKGADENYEYLAGAEYSIYKIGTFTQVNAGGTVGTQYTSTVPGLLTLDENTDPDSIDVTNLTKAVPSQTSNATTPLTFTLDDDSVYLVKETVTPAGISKANNFIITVPMYNKAEKTWDHTINAYPKNNDFDGEVEKTADVTVGDDGTKSVTVGDIVGYTVDVKVPSDIETANYDRFDIKDTSSKSLTIDTNTLSVSVTRNGVKTPLTSGQYGITYNAAATENVMTISFFNAAGTALYELKKGDEINIAYDAKVGPSANGSVSNRAGISADTDANTIEDKEDKEEIFTYSYGVKKIDKATTLDLAGAEFVLYTYDASNNKVYYVYDGTPGAEKWTTTADKTLATVKTSGANGLLSFDGFKAGEYYIEEVKAPTGYAKLKEDIKVTINKDSNDEKNTKGFSSTVENKLEDALVGKLPETGGYGIYLYIILGVALISVAALVYVKTRRKNPTV